MDLEKQAYKISEELDFHAAIMQESYNEILERPAGNPSQHYFRGSVKEAAENANSVYKEALQIIELQEIFDLGRVDEIPEEEVRLAKEKYFSRLGHDYRGDVGDAMDSHIERLFDSRKSDILGNDTGFHHLRSSVSQYEELVGKMVGSETRTEDAEIINEFETSIELDEINHILGRTE